MGGSLIIDTNVVIDLFFKRMPPSGGTYLSEVLNNQLYYLSDINRIELLGYSTGELETEFIKAIIDNAILLPITEPVVIKTIDLRKTHKIKLPDAIIAATALVHGLTLVSHNQKDFIRVEQLQSLDPYTL